MPRKFEKTDADAPADTKRFPIGLRVSKSVRERLEQAAAESGRSLSQEVELRLERSFDKQDSALDGLSLRYGERFAKVLIAMAEAGLAAGHFYGSIVATDRSDGIENWDSYPTAFQMASAAIHEVLEASRPQGGMKEHPIPASEALEHKKHPMDFARDALARIAGTETQLAEIDERSQRHGQLIAEFRSVLEKPEYSGFVDEFAGILKSESDAARVGGRPQSGRKIIFQALDKMRPGTRKAAGEKP